MSNIKVSEQVSLKEFEKNVFDEMKKAIEFFEKELSKIRTNRTHPSLIEDIKVNIYGAVKPLKAMAVITTPEANSLLIQPFDVSTIVEIEKALSLIDLGGQAKNDGKSIKIIIPPMSQSRRAELVKMVYKKQEESLIAVRKIRQDVSGLIKQAEKDKKLSEDMSLRFQKVLQNVLDSISNNLSTICKKKEASLSE
jgi:ribosome recycling factor